MFGEAAGEVPTDSGWPFSRCLPYTPVRLSPHSELDGFDNEQEHRYQ